MDIHLSIPALRLTLTVVAPVSRFLSSARGTTRVILDWLFRSVRGELRSVFRDVNSLRLFRSSVLLSGDEASFPGEVGTVREASFACLERALLCPLLVRLIIWSVFRQLKETWIFSSCHFSRNASSSTFPRILHCIDTRLRPIDKSSICWEHVDNDHRTVQ